MDTKGRPRFSHLDACWFSLGMSEFGSMQGSAHKSLPLQNMVLVLHVSISHEAQGWSLQVYILGCLRVETVSFFFCCLKSAFSLWVFRVCCLNSSLYITVFFPVLQNARGLGSQLKDSIPVTELSASAPFESHDLLRKGCVEKLWLQLC